MKKRFNPSLPIILGLCGKAGTGKTGVADFLVPGAIIAVDEEAGIMTDHIVLAQPLYELAAIRRQVEGTARKERILHETHQVLFELFGRSPLYGLPPYSELVELTQAVTALPIQLEGKPRSFLQELGVLCRNTDADCFVKHADRRIKLGMARAASQDLTYVAVVSDIRMENEASYVANSENGLLIRFNTDEEVRLERLKKRDGFLMSDSQLKHRSEKLSIPDNIIDLTIDSTLIDLETQAETVKNSLVDIFDIPDFKENNAQQVNI